MTFLRKFAKKLFANKYVDLTVILVVFFSILLLIFEILSGFVVTQKTIRDLTGIIETEKLEALKSIENKRYSENELINLLEQPWVGIMEKVSLYELNDETVKLITNMLLAKGISFDEMAVKTLKNSKFSEEELKEKLKELGLTLSEILKILMNTSPKIEYLSDKLSEEKMNDIKLLKNNKYTREELKLKLESFRFTHSDIKIVFNHVTTFRFNENEIMIILKESKLVFPISEETKNFLIELDDIIIAFFVLELLLRYVSCNNYKEFFSRYWIDILAVIPLFRVFRLGRVFLLLRLFRVFSFAVLLGRHLSFFSSIFNKRWIDFFLILIFLIFIITFGTIGLNSVEIRRHPDTEHAFWSTVFTLFSGQYIDDFPDTLIGRLAVLFIIIAGMSFFAILIGTVSAIMMEKFKEGIIMKKSSFEILENHIIICGWQEKTSQIINELHSSEEYKHTPIVVISHKEDFINTSLERFGINTQLVYLIEGDFTDPNILRKANIDNAKIAIILPDWSSGHNSRDIDARTVLTALTIEKLNSSVYSCAELLEKEYESHMRIGNVNEVIIGGYYSGLITAHSAINENLLPIIKNILPAAADHKLDNITVNKELIGKEFDFVIEEYRKKHRTLPIGVKTGEGKLLINPLNYIIKEGDCLIGLVNKK